MSLPRLAASVPLENIVEMQALGPQTLFTESDTRGENGAGLTGSFNRPSRLFWDMLRFEGPLN